MNKRMKLLPGVYLRAVQTDKFKTGCMSINFLRPLCREEAAKNALLPAVLLRGTRNYPDIMHISKMLDERYGATVGTLVRKKGEVHSWGFYADFIEDKYTLDGENVFASVCAFLRELLFDPVLEQGVFARSFVEGEKINLANTIAAEINDKRTYAVVRLLRTMCADEQSAVPRLGDRESVEAITPESLWEHYTDVLGTSPVELFYMGSKTPEEVAQVMTQMLEGLPRREPVQVYTEVIRQAGTVKEIAEAMDVTQGKLSIGFRTGCTCQDPEYPALQLLNAVYGSGVTSKLFQNVREKMSLCYYASSSMEKYKGLMVVSSGIEFDKYEVAKQEILHQLEDCRQGNITSDELEQARSYLISAYRIAKDRPGSLDDFYLGQMIAGLDETMDDQIEALRWVTLDDVVAAARRITLDTIYFLKGEEV